MPLTGRGRELLRRLPGAPLPQGAGVGCEVVRHEERCVGCGTCARACPTGATARSDLLDVNQILAAPPGTRRGELGAALRRIMRHPPTGPVPVPPRVTTLRTITYDAGRCRGCGTCARSCPAGAIEALPPRVDATPGGEGA